MEDNAYTRARVWDSKDTVPRELQFLQPLNASSDQATRIMVSTRKYGGSVDGSAQTLAISAAVVVQFNANTITTGSWTAPPQGAGVIFEACRAAIITGDASGKIQIAGPVIISSIPTVNARLNFNPTPLPFTFPAINGVSYQLIADMPMVPYLPSDGAYPNGPTAVFPIINTDAAATHTYTRSISYIYRYVYDIDTTKEKVYVMGTLS